MLNRVLLNLLLLAFTLAASAADVPNTVLRLDRADFVASDAAEPPADAAAWKPTRLPDEWDERPDAAGYGWYRLRFELREPPAGQVAVYSAQMRNVAEMFVNGKPVGRTGEFGSPDPHRAPVLLPFDAALLHAGANSSTSACGRQRRTTSGWRRCASATSPRSKANGSASAF